MQKDAPELFLAPGSALGIAPGLARLGLLACGDELAYNFTGAERPRAAYVCVMGEDGLSLR